MATAPSRSANAELSEGMTDGKYKKPNPNRGGFVEGTTAQERADLSTMIYNRVYTSHMVAPDGLAHTVREPGV